LPNTFWNSDQHAPQWIEIDLGRNYAVTGVVLLVAQAPEGQTSHNVLVRSSAGAWGSYWQVAASFAGYTVNGQALTGLAITPGGVIGAWAPVRYVRVETIESPSVVAWREIEVYSGAAGPCRNEPSPPGRNLPWPFQLRNRAPVVVLPLEVTPDMGDPRVGTALGSFNPSDPDTVVYPVGFRWVNTSFAGDPLNWQHVEVMPGVYSVDEAEDATISGYAANGIAIVMNLGVGDWVDEPDVTRFKDPAEIVRYGEYVRFMVNRFKDRVGYFELWNEPNATLELVDYLNVLNHVIPIVRAEAPDAKIVVPASSGWWEWGYPGYGSSGRNVLDKAFLFGVLDSVGGLVDAISWHPMFGNRADDPYYQGYPDLVREIKARAQSNGFEGVYLAEEMTWRTPDDTNDPTFQRVSPTVAAKYFVRTILLHRGLDTVPIIAPGAFDWASIRRTNVLLAGAEPVDLSLLVEGTAPDLERYAFSLPDGRRIVALWTDGVPSDDDVRTITDLSIDGLAGSTVRAIDVMDGSSQELSTSDIGGRLMIDGLLVTDYPLFLEISPSGG
jgi:hypothetical protein